MTPKLGIYLNFIMTLYIVDQTLSSINQIIPGVTGAYLLLYKIKSYKSSLLRRSRIFA